MIVTRGGLGTLVLDADVHEVHGPRVSAVETRGAGDALTAAVAATIAQGGRMLDGVRLGTAAGALNVARRGLGSGRRADIERLAGRVDTRRR